MARAYIVPANNVTVAGASTLVFLQTSATAPIAICEFVRAFCSYTANATSNQQRIQIATQVSTFPTLTSQAPVQLTASDPVSKIVGGAAGAAGTSGINASNENAGAKSGIYSDGFNVLNGWLWVPTPMETIVESAQSTAHGIGLNFPTAPATTTNWNAGMVFQERG
jgi:hypothetical protein